MTSCIICVLGPPPFQAHILLDSHFFFFTSLLGRFGRERY